MFRLATEWALSVIAFDTICSVFGMPDLKDALWRISQDQVAR
jgi:hypothetical protein